MSQTVQNLVKGAVDVAPPVSVAALHIAGVSLPDWVAITALIYTLMKIGHLAWVWGRSLKSKQPPAVEIDE